ncbi:MAG: GNAT family N-acetyltransferase [Gemmatimonadetes bacterium]|nr:GNAT family N-acetyltransferase [Gemmatimonadota bacterium]
MLKFGSVQKNRLLIRRIGSRGVALAAPEIIDVVRATIDCLHTWELFSTLGVAELDRALHRVGHEALGGAIHYTLSETDYASGGPVTDACSERLLLSDDPPIDGHFDGDYLDAFAVEEDGKCVSKAQIRWKTKEFIEIAVDTEVGYRGRGYGRAVVAAATDWILDQGAAGHYPVTPDNLPSCRIARSLGYKVGWFEIFGRELKGGGSGRDEETIR